MKVRQKPASKDFEGLDTITSKNKEKIVEIAFDNKLDMLENDLVEYDSNDSIHELSIQGSKMPTTLE